MPRKTSLPTLFCLYQHRINTTDRNHPVISRDYKLSKSELKINALTYFTSGAEKLSLRPNWLPVAQRIRDDPGPLKKANEY